MARLAAHFKDQFFIRFGTMDFSKNDKKYIFAKQFPKISLWPISSHPEASYEGPIEFEPLRDWIQEQAYSLRETREKRAARLEISMEDLLLFERGVAEEQLEKD